MLICIVTCKSQHVCLLLGLKVLCGTHLLVKTFSLASHLVQSMRQYSGQLLLYICLHTLSQRCTAMITGGGRGCDILTAMQAMPQQEVQFNAAQGFDGDHNPFGRRDSSAFFADTVCLKTMQSTCLSTSCTNRCC